MNLSTPSYSSIGSQPPPSSFCCPRSPSHYPSQSHLHTFTIKVTFTNNLKTHYSPTTFQLQLRTCSFKVHFIPDTPLLTRHYWHAHQIYQIIHFTFTFLFSALLKMNTPLLVYFVLWLLKYMIIYYTAGCIYLNLRTFEHMYNYKPSPLWPSRLTNLYSEWSHTKRACLVCWRYCVRFSGKSLICRSYLHSASCAPRVLPCKRYW